MDEKKVEEINKSDGRNSKTNWLISDISPLNCCMFSFPPNYKMPDSSCPYLPYCIVIVIHLEPLKPYNFHLGN